MAKSTKRLELLGLDNTLAQYRQLPAKIRKSVASALNVQVAATASELADAIAKDGVQRRSVVARLNIKKATADTDYASITLNTKRVPFRQIKFSTSTLDSSGTRAAVYVMQAGQRVRVYGFVNPYGKDKRPLIRYQKGGQSRLVRSAGVGLSGYWNKLVTTTYVRSVQLELKNRIKSGLIS